MKTGIIGCGNIADIYFSNSKKYFNNFEIVACADIKPEASKHYANIYNVENLTIDQIYLLGFLKFLEMKKQNQLLKFF